jgi:hypothetical protein
MGATAAHIDKRDGPRGLRRRQAPAQRVADRRGRPRAHRRGTSTAAAAAPSGSSARRVALRASRRRASPAIESDRPHSTTRTRTSRSEPPRRSAPWPSRAHPRLALRPRGGTRDRTEFMLRVDFADMWALSGEVSAGRSAPPVGLGAAGVLEHESGISTLSGSPAARPRPRVTRWPRSSTDSAPYDHRLPGPSPRHVVSRVQDLGSEDPLRDVAHRPRRGPGCSVLPRDTSPMVKRPGAPATGAVA